MNDYARLMSDTAFAAYRAGQHAAAELLLKQVVGTGWRDAYTMYFIGHLEYLQGNIAVATDYLSAAVAMDPNHARSHNDPGEALRTYRWLRREAPQSCFRCIAGCSRCCGASRARTRCWRATKPCRRSICNAR
jgi:predicted Zn-dependent protease